MAGELIGQSSPTHSDTPTGYQQAPGAAAASDEALGELTSVDALPILIVDDVPENLRALEAVLDPLGYPLRSASSGREALRMLLEEDFALILLDVRMPGIDGLETAELIKGRARSRDIPIVFLTAARDEVSDIIRAYGIGAVDYVLKPFDAELLRSKVAVFAQLESGRRALKRSEAFLRGAFEAAPIGKTVLDADGAIIRANPAFSRFVRRSAAALHGVPIAELCHVADRAALLAALDEAASARDRPDTVNPSVDLRLLREDGNEIWMAAVASAIETSELAEPLLLAQWVDLSARRRAERARADLLIEQAARAQAEAMAERLEKLQALTVGLEPLSLVDLAGVVAARLRELFGTDTAEVRLGSRDEDEPAVIVRAGDEGVGSDAGSEGPFDPARIEEVGLLFEGDAIGAMRLELAPGRSFGITERSLLHDAAERIALVVRRAQLHEEEHRIAVLLQRGLLPRTLPVLDGVTLAAQYEAAGVGAEVGGDWYDAFQLPDDRIGIVVGDVAGRSIPAASAMGELRTVTRTLALWGDGSHTPGEVLTSLNHHQLTVGEDQLFTLVYVIVDAKAGAVTWSAAGHPPPLLRTAEGETRFLRGGGGLIGIAESTYETHTEPIGEGDAVLLYTDGLVERRGESLDAGLARLASVVASGPQAPAALAEHVLTELIPSDERLGDDVTALVARIG